MKRFGRPMRNGLFLSALITALLALAGGSSPHAFVPGWAGTAHGAEANQTAS